MTGGAAGHAPIVDNAVVLLAAIAASSNDAIVAKDLDGAVTFWNPAAEAMFGYAAAEMIGASIARIIPADRYSEEAAILERMRRGERLSHFETERVTKDGRIIPVSITLSPIRDATGTIIGASKIARDLTEARRIRAQLEQRQALLQSVLDTVPDGLIVIDRAGVVLSFSPAAEKTFGYAAADIVGSNVSVLMPGNHAPAHDAYIARYLATGQRRIIGIGRTVAGLRKDGTTFPMELQIGEVAVSGEPRFTGFVRDLTAREARERRLSELQAELIHVSRLSELGQMASALAHEVDQPLTAIANYARGVRHLLTAAVPPPLHEAIGKMADQAKRAHTIVQSLRGLVKKETRPGGPHDLATIIEETSGLALIGTGRSLRLDLRLAPDAAFVCVDRVQIQQVILNLMRNAVQAMADRPGSTLVVSTARRENRIEVRIADNGPGLPETIRKRLFQPFMTTKQDGLGIGLSICCAIVQAHGGELTAADGTGSGAVFSFTLPAPDAAGIYGTVDDDAG